MVLLYPTTTFTWEESYWFLPWLNMLFITLLPLGLLEIHPPISDGTLKTSTKKQRMSNISPSGRNFQPVLSVLVVQWQVAKVWHKNEAKKSTRLVDGWKLSKKFQKGEMVKKVAGENGEDVSSNLHTIHLGELVTKGFLVRKIFGAER